MNPAKERRAGNRSRKLSVEGLEARCLMATTLPDVVMVSATTADSKSVTFDYAIENGNDVQPLDFAVYRSPTPELGPGAVKMGQETVSPLGAPGGPTLDAAGQPAWYEGAHQLTTAIPGGLPPDPADPYVLVVAEPGNAATSTTTTADFRTYVIGVITHGGLQPKSWTRTGPPWERKMADELLAEGYDAVIPVNWVGVSGTPGAAAEMGPRVAAMIVQAAAKFPAGAVVDLHLIGHSEGAVVNSQALIRLNEEGLPADLQRGYIKMTMLDPHAANNGVPGPQDSVAEGLLGWIAKQEINTYQSKAQDPPVVVPLNVQDAEVFYQHTPVLEADTNHGLYNLWGQVPVHGQATYFDLTAPGVSHAGKFSVYDWYQINVVPTLGTGGQFVEADALSGAEVGTTPASSTSSASGRETVTYAGSAAPGARVRLFAAQGGTKVLARIGETKAGPDGSWRITSRPIAPGYYRVVANSDAPVGPRGPFAAMRPTAWLGHVGIGPPTASDPLA